MAAGERFIHDVYTAVRTGPAWNSTLLIVTYDEHGGCYDHVPPPADAVAPDTSSGEFGFDFHRYGLRVPAVLVSPLIEAGTVFRVPDGNVPLDHTSILKTLEDRFGLPPLTARDAAAPGIGDVLTLTTPRTDDPLDGVIPPQNTDPGPAAGVPSHLQQIQAELLARTLPPGSEPRPLRTEADYEQFITSQAS